MSQETVKIYATKSCELNTRFEVNTEKKEILYAAVFSNYTETPYIGFDIDISALPDTVSFCFYADNSEYSKITRANGYWDETTRIYNMPGYTSSENDQKIVLGLNTVENVPKESLSNGFVIYRYENGGPTYVYSTRYNDESKRPYVEYIKYTPEARNFNIIGNSIDENIVCQWENEDVTSWKVEVIQNDILIASKTGTSENTCTFVPGDINVAGKVIFKLNVYHGTSSNEYTKEVELSGTQVKLFSIEPNLLPQKIYQPIELTITGENMTNLDIKAVQNGTTKYSKVISNNTLSTVSENILANTFSSGTVNITVTATYNGPHYSNSVTQSVSFVAYGKPKAPTLNVQEEYATPSPLISWVLDVEQIQYQVIFNDEVVQDVYSSNIHSYQLENLENNKYYTVKVRIKNQYNEWSDYSSATFKVSFAELETPEVNVYSDRENSCIVIVATSPQQDEFVKHEIYRRNTSENKWIKIKSNLPLELSFSDYSCGSGVLYEYKVRAVSNIGTFKDSSICSSKVDFTGRMISVPNTDICIELTNFDTIKDSLADILYNSNSSYLGICGLSVPKEVKYTQRHKTFSCKCCFETKEEYDKFLELEDEEILLYRDGKGEAFYCTIQIKSTTDSAMYYKYISFTVTETYYSGVEYDKPVYFGYSKREW